MYSPASKGSSMALGESVDLISLRHESIPDHPRLDRFHPPEEIGLYLPHLRDKALRFLACIKHYFVADLPGPQLFAFPESIRHSYSFNSQNLRGTPFETPLAPVTQSSALASASFRSITSCLRRPRTPRR